MKNCLKPQYENLYCIVAKHERNKIPHLVSCMIGIDNEYLANGYAKDLAKDKDESDKRKKAYEWTKPEKLSFVINNSGILISDRDKRILKSIYFN